MTMRIDGHDDGDGDDEDRLICTGCDSQRPPWNSTVKILACTLQTFIFTKPINSELI